MTLRERAEAHLLAMDAQLVELRRQAAAHAQKAAELSAEAQAFQIERDKWAADLAADAALTAQKAKRKRKVSDG